MDETKKSMQHYLSPLTLEANIFLKTIEMHGQSNQMDPILFDQLENIVVAIEKLLQRCPDKIVQTAGTKLVPVAELSLIDCLYQCRQCNMDLGKSVAKATLHLVDRHQLKSRKERRNEKSRADKEKRMNEIAKLPKKVKALVAGGLPKFFNLNLPIADKLKTIPEYDIIEKELLDLISPGFPDKTVKLYKFGSRISGIGTAYSDLDIFVDIGNTFNTFENRPSDVTLKNLGTVCAALKTNRKAWLHLISIENARVPILKVCNAKTGIECDIGFSNSLGYCNTKLLEYLFDLQPVARRMCIFLKKWLEKSRLNDQITSYSMALMVIYFLQIKNLLPSIESLQADLTVTQQVGPWIANFVEKSLVELNIEKVDISSEDECQRLLKLFFHLYADFKFGTSVVCPYFGRRVHIASIESEMPKRYSAYSESVKDSALQLKKPIIVQDPIQLNHNVTKSISASILKNIQDYFLQSASELAYNVSETKEK